MSLAIITIFFHSKLRVCLRQRQAKKEEKQGAIYRRWMQDRDMQEGDRLMLFEEYIEMGE